MPQASRPRRHAPGVLPDAACIAACIAVCLLLAACDVTTVAVAPNSTFVPHTEFGNAINDLWNLLLRWGTGVFIFVEGLLVYTIVRYRARPGDKRPTPVHGNTTLEILWTVIPLGILIAIAIPTVKTIFITQAKASADALQVEVYGHQWWWEFKYPQYGITTADELYLPIGRKVNFTLRSNDVLHSFWIPQMGGKRDLITNRTNYLWFTPDSSMAASVWNGSCNEYCGTSHGDMRFRVFTVPAGDFERWAAHQAAAAVYTGPPAPPVAPATPAQAGGKGAPGKAAQGKAPAPAAPAATPVQSVASTAGAAPPGGPAGGPSDQGEDIFPRDHIPVYNMPATPTPEGLAFTPGLIGDPARGLKTFSSTLCIACHAVKGNPSAVATVGPNLTHVGSRYTIAGSLYPNDTTHMRLWIKNARAMKPGVLMPSLGLGQYDPVTKSIVSPGAGGLSDQQIADIVAYLQALK
jgi:cytochrome c oxidase subunit II